MKPMTGLLIVGGAGLAAFALTRGALAKPTPPPAPPPPRDGGGSVIVAPKPVPGYAQALYDAPSGQWYWFPQPQPYVIDAQGYPVPAQAGQSPAGMGIPIPNPYGQIPGAPDLQTSSVAPTDAWYGFNPVGLVQTTDVGFFGIVTALAMTQSSGAQDAPGSQAWLFVDGAVGVTLPALLAQAVASRAYVFIAKDEVDFLKGGKTKPIANVYVVPAANVPGFVGAMRTSVGEVVLLANPNAAT